MPFKSQAQRRKFYAMANRGEISHKTVKKWEEHTPKGKLPEKVAAAFFDELTKMAQYAVSEYSGPLGYGRFKQESSIPPFVSPQLKVAGPPSEKKKLAVGLSPKGILSEARRVGGPRLSSPMGPSTADISKPLGFGQVLPGAGKGAI
jgi:hypothetical protein